MIISLGRWASEMSLSCGGPASLLEETASDTSAFDERLGIELPLSSSSVIGFSFTGWFSTCGKGGYESDASLFRKLCERNILAYVL